MRRTKDEAAATREQLLQAALISFSTKGYILTTLDDIARQAGTTRGAIHWHFGSKAELFNTLVRETYERAAHIFREVFNADGTPLQVLRQLLVRWIRYTEEDADFRAVLELTQFKTGLTPELSSGMEEKFQGTERVKAIFTDLIRKGIAAGEIRANVDPEMAALSALYIVNGLSSEWLLNPASFPLASYAERIVDFYIQGITSSC